MHIVRLKPEDTVVDCDGPVLISINGNCTADGVCDMTGNVAEWTLDYFTQDYTESFSDARPFLGGITAERALARPFTHLRVARGGAWTQNGSRLLVTSRGRMNRNSGRNLNAGIRLVGSTCGNGVIDPGEACDDGNHESFDGCNFLCKEGDL